MREIPKALCTTFILKDLKGTRLIAVPNGKKHMDKWVIRKRKSNAVMTGYDFVSTTGKVLV